MMISSEMKSSISRSVPTRVELACPAFCGESSQPRLTLCRIAAPGTGLGPAWPAGTAGERFEGRASC